VPQVTSFQVDDNFGDAATGKTSSKPLPPFMTEGREKKELNNCNDCYL
jgi:hypothetical protein